MNKNEKSSGLGPFKKAKWIWPDGHAWNLRNSYVLFRRDFHLEKIPSRAPLFVTADQSYQLYVNGRYVSRGPARGFQCSWPYDELELKPFLRRGRNVLALRVHNPGFSNFQYITESYAGLLLEAKWGALELFSNKDWKARRQSGVSQDTVPTSIQLFCQEHIDLRIEDPSWMEQDHDDSEWQTNLAEAALGSMPWHGLEARGLPLLEEKRIVPAAGLGTAIGVCAKGYRQTTDVTRLRHAEGLAHRAGKFDAELLVVPAGTKGRYQSYLLDFGKTVVGSAGFEIEGAAGVEILDTLHVETLDEENLAPHFEPDKHSRMAFGHRLICRSGAQSHSFYHSFGFRYMVLTVRGHQTELRIRPFLRTGIYPLRQKGRFHSSDAVLQAIWETCAWTQRVCSLDAYVDTPWREQAQWWGDARVQAKNTFFYSGDTRLFRRGISQISGQTLANGLTYGHAPTMAHGCILPDFTLIWMLTLWDFYWQTGSLEPFQAHGDGVRKALDYFEGQTDFKTGLVAYDRRYWLFLDWTGIFKEGYSTVYNLWLLIALEKMEALSKAAGADGEAARLLAWHGRLRRSLLRLVREDGLICDGITFQGKQVGSASIHAQTLAIMAGLQPAGDRGRIGKVLIPFIRQEHTPEISPSCYWITYVFEILGEAGYGGEVADYIRKKWAPMAVHGTTWEVFQPKVGDESFSHAWSAHPLYHLMQTLGGIRQAAPRWKKVVFQPVFRGTEASTVIPTPAGEIRSSWKREQGRKGGLIRVALDLPAGVTAEVRLPGEKRKSFKGKNRWKLRLPERKEG